MDNIIFLDIDGVLNCEDGFANGFCRYDKENHDMGMDFYPPSRDFLNRLIDETKSKVVISSTWRLDGLDMMQEIWKYRKMSGEVIDITPRLYSKDFDIPRGIEIKKWLNNKNFSHINWNIDLQKEYMEKSGIRNYLILDDDSDMLYQQRKHFVHVLPSPRNKSGFNETYFNESLKILKKNLIEIQYGK